MKSSDVIFVLGIRADTNTTYTEHWWSTFANLDPSAKEVRLFSEQQRRNQLEIDTKIGNILIAAAQSRRFGKFYKHRAEIRLEMNESLNSVRAMVAAELEQQKVLNGNKFAEIERLYARQGTVVKMEEYQKEQQLNISDLQKTVAAMLNDTINGKALIQQQNRWDSAACHKDLTLIGPNRLIVEDNGMNWGISAFHSVLAERPIPRKNFGIFYYEVKIIWDRAYTGSSVSIGLGTKQMPLNERVGLYDGTYAYKDGQFWGHAVEGCSYWKGRPYIGEKPSFGVGDVVGCGVNLATRQIIYTKNGRRLETTGLRVDSAADLSPCVTLYNYGTKIEANFGPNFKFNIAVDGI
uniref:B30.2/SPRY domain-containing protein n=1 Tax=Globodera rostochiensis TaxID=31243 RepID=A0A914HSK4_GLORO